MATTKFYLDTRNAKAGKTAPLKIAVTHKGKTALIHLCIHLLPEQWDKTAGRIVGHPNKFALNNYITKRRQDIDSVILKLTETGEIARLSAMDIKKRITASFCTGSRKLTVSIPNARTLSIASLVKGFIFCSSPKHR